MKEFTKIKNLVFDFGGVIYQIDHDKQIKAFSQIGLNNFENYYSQAMQQPLFADFEKGLISENDFRLEVKGFLGLNLTDDQIDETWNSILVDYMMESIDLLIKLKARYRLYLLSNTNSIHYKLYITQFFDKFGYDFSSLFNHAFWSFQIGKRKPDAEIFQFVVVKGKMKPDESIFIDDSFQNTVASADSGLPALWLKPGKKLTDLFDKELNLILE